MHAAVCGKVDTMRYLHSLDDTLCQARDDNNDTALTLGSKESVKYMITELKVDVAKNVRRRIETPGVSNWNLDAHNKYGKSEGSELINVTQSVGADTEKIIVDQASVISEQQLIVGDIGLTPSELGDLPSELATP